VKAGTRGPLEIRNKKKKEEERVLRATDWTSKNVPKAEEARIAGGEKRRRKNMQTLCDGGKKKIAGIAGVHRIQGKTLGDRLSQKIARRTLTTTSQAPCTLAGNNIEWVRLISRTWKRTPHVERKPRGGGSRLITPN